jgi:hypothetical protein
LWRRSVPAALLLLAVHYVESIEERRHPRVRTPERHEKADKKGCTERITALGADQTDLLPEEFSTPSGKMPARRDRWPRMVPESAKSPYSDTMVAIAGKTANRAKKAHPTRCGQNTVI